MGGQTPPEDGDSQQDSQEQRRERRGLIRQLLIDWSPVLATVTSLALRHFS
ncbi:hypothetical protein [Streptomyces sp. NPDC055056]